MSLALVLVPGILTKEMQQQSCDDSCQQGFEYRTNLQKTSKLKRISLAASSLLEQLTFQESDR